MPFISGEQGNGVAKNSYSFPGWPAHFEGRKLTPLPLSAREERFGRDFPGKLGRFTDGEREIIIRWVTEPTRKLHPATDCFAGVGYATNPLPLRIDQAGNRWSAFTASRSGENLQVYERIFKDEGDGNDSGASWTDASAWYWATIVNTRASGPWWALTVADRR